MEKWLEIGLKCYFILFLILFTNAYHKIFSFENTDKLINHPERRPRHMKNLSPVA